MSLPEPPKREDYPSRQAFRGACRAYEKRNDRAVSMAGRPPMQRLVELEKKMASVGPVLAIAARAAQNYDQIVRNYERVIKILEANGLTDTPLIVRPEPGMNVPRNPDA